MPNIISKKTNDKKLKNTGYDDWVTIPKQKIIIIACGEIYVMILLQNKNRPDCLDLACMPCMPKINLIISA